MRLQAGAAHTDTTIRHITDDLAWLRHHCIAHRHRWRRKMALTVLRKDIAGKTCSRCAHTSHDDGVCFLRPPRRTPCRFELCF
jgi:hypothetical protein